MGGVQAGLVARKGKAGLPVPDIQIKYKDSSAKVSKTFTDSLKESLKKLNSIKEGDWSLKVLRGKEAKELEPAFWRMFILGDDELDIKGLATILYEDGFRWSKRSDGDMITNFMTDVVSNQGEEFQPFLDEFNKITGKNLTAKEFGDAMATSFSEMGKGLSIQSRSERLLRSGVNPTVDKVIEEELKDFGVLGKAGWGELRHTQNNLIRLLVANPATTLRNIRGWGVYSSINTVNDLALASLYGLGGTITGSKASLRKASALASAQRVKLKSILDPEMSYETFQSMVRLHGDAFKNLSHTQAGGVVDNISIARAAGLNPSDNVISKFNTEFDKFADFASIVSGVKVQDAMTKSIEFNTQMDKFLKLEFGIGLEDFYTKPDAAELISTPKYAKALTKAISETEKSIFGKSYKGPTNLGEIAKVIEEFRSVPGLGFTIPFGRFFNNTVAFMSDHTSISFWKKLAVGGVERDFDELAMRSAIGWSAITAWAINDYNQLQEGEPLRPFTHMQGVGGATVDVASEFPLAQMQVVARALAYSWHENHMTKGEYEEGIKILTGQITRGLGQTAKETNDLVEAIFAGEGQGRQLTEMIGSVAFATPMQAATRFMDPVNEAAGLIRGQNATVTDRRQGIAKLTQGLRNLDQIIGFMTGHDLAPQKYTAYAGKATRRPSKVFASKEVDYTNTMILMDHVGVPYYQLDSYSKSPEADNRWNQLFFEVMENEAEQLIHSEHFQKIPREKKIDQFRRTVEKSRERVYEMLEDSVQVEDQKFFWLLKISQKEDWLTIDRKVKELGYPSLEDMSIEELEIFKYWLDNKTKITDDIYNMKK